MLTVTIHVLFNSSWDLFDFIEWIRKPAKGQVDPYDFMEGVKYEDPHHAPRHKPGAHPQNILIAMSAHQDDVDVEDGIAVASSKSQAQDLHVLDPSEVQHGHTARTEGAAEVGGGRGAGEAMVVARNYGFM